jgi:hypothetical protein
LNTAIEQTNLPLEIIERIIEYCPCGQWFTVSKEICALASNIISPLDERKNHHCGLCWSIKKEKTVAALYLLKNFQG